MKCSNKDCPNDAVAKIFHVGTNEVFYCEEHLGKYWSITLAMGDPMPPIYRLDKEVGFK